jgi:hypothetical protein
MEFITQHLGTNKVTSAIHSNEYEESHSYVKSPCYFDRIEDLVEKFKSSVVQQEKIQLKGVNGFLACVFESIDPMCGLLSMDTLMTKISMFRDKLVMHEHQLPKKLKKTTAEHGNIFDEFLLEYVSFVLKKGIAICHVGNWIWANVENYDMCVVIRKHDNDSYTVESSCVPVSDIKSIIMRDRIRDFVETDGMQKLNEMLVKDMRDIAEHLWLPTFKIVDNKKKIYLKNELKKVIEVAVEQYKK